ncbi:MAG: hypothetical protein ACU836_06850 [Gammaproteobacteria bacterium]
MGGTGSGRRYQNGKSTTNDMRMIDIRYLQRECVLIPERTSNLDWSRCGSVIASIQITAKTNRVILSYRYQKFGSDWQNVEYPVYLEKTNCHLGGERIWFNCPAQGCGKRVAILYGGRIFVCRHCHQLAYASTRENINDRAARKADRIRERLGWEAGILNANGTKAKGMHWKTFQRLQIKHDVLVNQSLGGIIKRLRLFEDE